MYRTYGRYGEIKNHRLFPDDGPLDGPVITYKLSPEELAKYQKYQKEGTANMGVKKEKIPAPPKEEMEELIKQHHGSINAMSLAKGVSWQVVKNWLRELGLEDFAKEESQRYKDTINKLNELKKLCNKKKLHQQPRLPKNCLNRRQQPRGRTILLHRPSSELDQIRRNILMRRVGEKVIFRIDVTC